MTRWRDIRRRVLVAGESKRSVQARYGLHFRTLQKILEHAEPPGYRQKQPRRKVKLAGYLPIIEQIINDDKSAPRKQRHTIRRIFDRLQKEHGYEGGYTMVGDAVRALKATQAEVFVPLSHPPGEAQVDFGFAHVDLDGERQKVALFVISLPYSDALHVTAFPLECTESFQEGHNRAFRFFGGVPRRISYDNSKVAVASIFTGRARTLTREFLRLQSHYLFDEHFCLVRRPNEKGHVETLVGYARRNTLVPVPKFASFEALNAHLASFCEAELSRTLRGKSRSKGQLLEEEQGHFLPLPRQSFEARRVEQTTASSLSLVRFHTNDYSVPTSYAHHPVTVIGGIEDIRVICRDRVVARHRRRWTRHGVYFDPVHYLALLERKPGALDVAKPLADWDLPECFGILRRRLEASLDDEGTRAYIKVLRLLEQTTINRLAHAIEHALVIGATSDEAIRLILENRHATAPALFSLDTRPHLSWVRVQKPDLALYQKLTQASSEQEVAR